MNEPQSVIELLRAATARREALRTYARSHDRFAEQEQELQTEHPVEASGAHEYALIALRAYRAEMDDPTPKSPQQLDHENREGQWP